MNKFTRSWMLVKRSLSVLSRNKKLLVFPIVISICTAVIILFFLAPPLLRPTGHSYSSGGHWEAISHSLFQNSQTESGSQTSFTPGALAYIAFLYFLAMFTATFFNVAFYHEILAALSGQAVSILRGLKFAATRWKSIFMWTLLAGLVGLLIKLIEERLAFVGSMIAKLIGIAWSVAAVFAIPVIVRGEQGANPLAVLRGSADALKRTWGEALIGYVGLTFANMIILFGSVALLTAALVISIALENFWILISAGVVWLLAVSVWTYVTSVASHVYRGALYLYAAEGTIPEPYTQELLDMAWKFKRA